MPYSFVDKLNANEDGSMHVVEEQLVVTAGKYEGFLAHDNIVTGTITVYTGSRYTGDVISNVIISVPANMPWRRYVKIFAPVDTVYVTYETPGDTVEADDLNVLQEGLTATQEELERYESVNDRVVEEINTRLKTTEAMKAEQTYVDTHLLMKADKSETYTKTETDARIGEVIGAAPEALDTLQEIADALNNDPDFAATMTTALAGKVDKVSGKGLSAEDYTTAEKTKLAGIAASAGTAGSATDTVIGSRTANDTTIASFTGTITNLFSGIFNLIKGITGKPSALTAPATTLEAANTHMIATTGIHGATSAANANAIVQRDSAGRAKVATPSESDDIARKDTVDAVQSSLTAHIGSNGSAHAEVTTSTAGFMSTSDKAKLDGVAAGANAYVHPNHTGDITSTGDGVTAIAAGVIVDADVNASAGINATKIGTGTVSNTELGYLDGVTSAIQTQLDAKLSATGNAVSSTKLATARTLALTGDATASGSFDGSANLSMALTLASSGAAAGTYKSVTVDAKGRVTGGTNPTTLAGYGITDGVTRSELGAAGYGDMMASVYDVDGDGKVDASKQADSVPWSGVTGKPTTLSGYGITDVITTNSISNSIAKRNASGDLGANILVSTVADGTAPINVQSNTVVPGLNADRVDGIHGTDLAPKASPTFTGTATLPYTIINGSIDSTDSAERQIKKNNANASHGFYLSETNVGLYDWKNGVSAISYSSATGRTKINSLDMPGTPSFTNVSGTAPFVVASTTPVTNLNADLLDGYHASTTAVANTVPVYNASAQLVGSITGNAPTATRLASARTLSFTGEATGSGSFDGSANVATALTLAASGVTAGTYRSVTVDAKGRVTAGANPGLTWNQLKGV